MVLTGPTQNSRSLPEVTVRSAVPADAEAIARVHVDTWRSAYKGILPDECLAKLSYGKGTARWSTTLSAKRKLSIVYVAEIGGTVVGFAGGGPEREGHAVYTGELYGIYVLPSQQRRGTGRSLVGAVARELMRCGFEAALVWVLAENPCRAFYEALGGEIVSRKEAEIGGARVIEVAYGWTSLGQLIEHCLGPATNVNLPE